MNKQIKIALVGQPNVGKSMLINSISNAKLRVGNFTGVTVEKKSVRFEYEGQNVEIVDLPGLYALSDYGEDEKVTSEFLRTQEYDLILNVVDSTNLERNLALTAQLQGLDKKMIVALNMSDEARSEAININVNQLSKLLGTPCIEVSALTKEGIETLFLRSVELTKFPYTPHKLVYGDVIEEEVNNIVKFLKARNFKNDAIDYLANSSYRHIALNLLREDKQTYKAFLEEPIWLKLHEIVLESHEHIFIHHDTQDVDEIFAYERASMAKGLVTETVTATQKMNKDITQRIDDILINKYIGIPLFLFFMWGLFQITFEVGSIPMDWIDAGFIALGDAVGNNIQSEMWRSLIVDGMIAGVGAVVMFLPNILILFLGIALLETTGYMSRVAFILDGFFHKFGLHGKSFIPLVTGFGCSVPAYMAARILKSERDRLLTLFIIGFMSCGARLPIYVLFIAAFFKPEHAGNILFGIYLSGALLGLLMAKVLKVVVFKGGDEPFVMEMPKYRMPSLRLIWHTVMSQARLYLKKAGTFILAATVLIWFASNYPKNHDAEQVLAVAMQTATPKEKVVLENEAKLEALENSYLGQVGKFTEPVFAPLGFDWKMTVALETGLAAKEVVVATLGILYSLGDEVTETSKTLSDRLKENISLPAALAFIVFVMIYLPCLAASAVFTREAGHVKYLGYLIVFTTGTAYVFSWLTYIIAGALV